MCLVPGCPLGSQVLPRRRVVGNTGRGCQNHAYLIVALLCVRYFVCSADGVYVLKSVV